MNSTTQTTTTTEWGTIPILTSENYAQWRMSCEICLAAARSLYLVNEDVIHPVLDANNPTKNQIRLAKQFEKHQRNAISILNNSVSSQYKAIISAHEVSGDIRQMWLELEAAASRANDHLFIYRVRQQFGAEVFSPSLQTVFGFVDILRTHANKIIGTPHQLTDEDIKKKLLNSLPTSESWFYAKVHCLTNRLSLPQTISFLSILEPIGLPGPIVADTTQTNQRGRGNYRGERGSNSRGRARRTPYNRNQSVNQKNKKNRGENESEKGDGDDACWFCRQPGHIQRSCRLYIEAKSNARSRTRARDNDAVYTNASYFANQ